jgi:hypothetical protein
MGGSTLGEPTLMADCLRLLLEEDASVNDALSKLSEPAQQALQLKAIEFKAGKFNLTFEDNSEIIGLDKPRAKTLSSRLITEILPQPEETHVQPVPPPANPSQAPIRKKTPLEEATAAFDTDPSIPAYWPERRGESLSDKALQMSDEAFENYFNAVVKANRGFKAKWVPPYHAFKPPTPVK